MISSNCMVKMLAIGFCAYLGSIPISGDCFNRFALAICHNINGGRFQAKLAFMKTHFARSLLLHSHRTTFPMPTCRTHCGHGTRVCPTGKRSSATCPVERRSRPRAESSGASAASASPLSGQLHRGDLVTLLKHPKAEPLERATAVAHAIDVLRASKIPVRPRFKRQSFQLDEMQISRAASRSPVLFALQLISAGP